MLSEMIHPTAIIAEGVSMLGNCWVGAKAEIGPQVRIGVNCLIGERVRISGAVVLGACVEIGNDTVLVGPLKIGDHCVVGESVIIGSDNHPTILEQGCLVGHRSVILGGSHLKEGAFVKAGSRVNTEVPAHGLVAGDPCALYAFLCPCGGNLRPVGGPKGVQTMTCFRCRQSLQINISDWHKCWYTLLPGGDVGPRVPPFKRLQRWNRDLDL